MRGNLKTWVEIIDQGGGILGFFVCLFVSTTEEKKKTIPLVCMCLQNIV